MRRLILCWLLAAVGCFEDQVLPPGEDGTEGATTSSATDGMNNTSSGPGAPTSASTEATLTSSTLTDATATEGPATDDTITDSSPTGPDTGAEECPPTAICLAVPDAAWSGPVAVAVGDVATGAAACPAGWSSRPSGYADIETPPFTCNCACAGPNDATCTFDLTFTDSADCGGSLLQTIGVGPGDCAMYLGGGGHGVYANGTATNIQCAPPFAPSPSPASFGTQLDACAPVLGPACPDGQCVPLASPPFDERLCVFRDGEHECPAPFDEQFVVYDGIEDTRSCPCECEPTYEACSGTVIAYDSGSCDFGQNETPFVTGGCVGIGGDLNAASVTSVYANIICGAQNDAPAVKGAIAGAGARTFCCTGV